LTLLGMSGAVASWVVGTEGYLGGAHPYASKSVLATDVDSGRPVDLSSGFKGRDLAAEALGAKAASECVRHLAGAVPVDGLGGEVTWLAVLTHEFEVCAGGLKLVKVAAPGPGSPPLPAGGVTVADGTLTVGGVKVQGVADWRASRSADAVVAMMALGREDTATARWQQVLAAPDGRTREIRAWVPGMPVPVVIGRASAIVAVQFLTDHPAQEKALKAMTGL
jgi:hypothetical protein